MSSKQISDSWPFSFDMRNTQKLALNWLSKNKDKKYFIMQIPVGGGKSFIGLTFSRFLDKANIGSSYIMTPQVMLQKQYLNDFNYEEHKVDTIYGKSRYTCRQKKTNCEIGARIKKVKCDSCPYKIALQKVQSNKNLVINYSAAFSHFSQETKVFMEPRTLLVADECHTLESQLTEFDSCSMEGEYAKSKLNLEWIKDEKDPFNVFVWLTQVYYKASLNRIMDMELEIDEMNDQSNGSFTPDQLAFIREYEELKRKHGDIAAVISPYMTSGASIEEQFELFDKDYILISTEMVKKFKARSGAKAFSSLLEPHADKFLFMSSTIIDHASFCKDLGIDMDDAAFFDIDSEFEISNRMIYRIPTTKMDRTWKAKERQPDRDRMIDTVSTITNLHRNESGIIHTTNFEIASWLVNNLKGNINQEIYHHNDDRYPREKVIKAFLNNPKPSLLISPSSTEGLDLKGDLGRFAIFTKVPYPFLGDQWIRAKCNESQEWYTRQAILSIIQGSGRVIRSKDDYGSVYILDDLFDRLYRDWKQKFPKWWRDSVVRIEKDMLG